MSRLVGEPDWDLIVVGGGIHGAGVAQAAAAAGHRVLLLEKDRLGFGTSGRSSKLIHGGLRYLESLSFGLVRESLAERELLLRLAPGLVHRVPFFIPVYRDTRRRPWQVRLGLGLYALLGGLGEHARFSRVPRTAWDGLDGLTTAGLEAVFRYSDAQTDDAALTRAVARSAIELGATVALGSPFVSATADIFGYRVAYRSSGGERQVATRTLVNAAGPWVERVLGAIHPRPRGPEVELVQGAHVLLAGCLDAGVYYAEAPSDGRVIFFMPWAPAGEPVGVVGRAAPGGESILVGTTETRFAGDPGAVAPLPHEIDYLVSSFARYFPERRVERLGAFAGLRVLPRGPGAAFGRSRELLLGVDDPRRPRLVTVYGGKLTGYRLAAEKVLERLAPALPRRRPQADTAELPLG